MSGSAQLCQPARPGSPWCRTPWSTSGEDAPPPVLCVGALPFEELARRSLTRRCPDGPLPAWPRWSICNKQPAWAGAGHSSLGAATLLPRDGSGVFSLERSGERAVAVGTQNEAGDTAWACPRCGALLRRPSSGGRSFKGENACVEVFLRAVPGASRRGGRCGYAQPASWASRPSSRRRLWLWPYRSPGPPPRLRTRQRSARRWPGR